MKEATIEKVLADLKKGRLVILRDDSESSDRGCFVLGASAADPELINQMIFYGRSNITLAMPQSRFDQLDLPVDSEELSIDAAEGISSGLSALDRSHTVKVAGAADASPEDVVRPGNIYPVEVEDGGCLVRPLMADAAYDLIRLAGRGEVATVCEILNAKGEFPGSEALEALAKELKVSICSIQSLVEYRFVKEPLIERINSVDLPTEYGNFRLHVYKASFDKSRGIDLALTFGKDSFDEDDVPLVRVHSEWSIANIVNRLSFKEGSFLNRAMKKVSDSGEPGAIIFLRNTPEQHTNSLFRSSKKPADIWIEDGIVKTLAPMGETMSYGFGAQILRDLGVRRMKVLSNKGTSFKGIDKYGLEIVDQVRF